MCGSTIVRPCLTSWKAASRLVLRYNVSVPRRLNLRPCSPAPAPDKGSPWRSAQCAGRRHGLAALQPGDHGLRRSHRLGDPFLRLVGFAARLDDRGGDGELVFPRVMGRDKFPVLDATPARALGGDVFPALVPPSPISGPWGFRPSHAFRNTAACVMFVRKMDFCFSVIGAHARFKLLSNGTDAPR